MSVELENQNLESIVNSQLFQKFEHESKPINFKKHLSDNLIKETDEKKRCFECQSCERTFLSKAHLERHIVSVHQGSKD